MKKYINIFSLLLISFFLGITTIDAAIECNQQNLDKMHNPDDSMKFDRSDYGDPICEYKYNSKNNSTSNPDIIVQFFRYAKSTTNGLSIDMSIDYFIVYSSPANSKKSVIPMACLHVSNGSYNLYTAKRSESNEYVPMYLNRNFAKYGSNVDEFLYFNNENSQAFENFTVYCPEYAAVDNDALYFANGEDYKKELFGTEGSSSYIPYGQLLSGTTYAQYKYNKEHPSDPNQGGNGGDPQVIQQGQDIIIGDFKVSTWSATKDYSESKPSTPTGIALEGNLCTATATLRVLKILHGLINISKLAIPLFLIIIGVVTMFTAMMSNDKDATTKAAASFAKKLAVGVAIFFIPTIINIVANLVSNYEKTVNKFSACQVCFFGDKDYSMDTCTKVINALESINNSDDSSAAKSASIEDVFSVATNSLYITSKEVAKSTVGLFVRIAGNVIEYNVDLPNVLN